MGTVGRIVTPLNRTQNAIEWGALNFTRGAGPAQWIARLNGQVGSQSVFSHA